MCRVSGTIKELSMTGCDLQKGEYGRRRVQKRECARVRFWSSRAGFRLLL